MEVTYYGHSCVSIKIGDTHLLVDPFIANNPLASHIDINTIPADYILITSAQQDHISDVEQIAKRTKAQIISNFENQENPLWTVENIKETSDREAKIITDFIFG